MFERFTDQARRSVMLAEDAARDLAHAYVGTEHLLLGLVANDQGVAHRALGRFDVTAARARAEVGARVGPAAHGPGAVLPLTASAKGVLERSQWEARQLRADRIGTSHLLLGLLRPADTSAVDVLAALEVAPEDLRAEVLDLLDGGAEDAAGADGTAAPAGGDAAADPPVDGGVDGPDDGHGDQPPGRRDWEPTRASRSRRDDDPDRAITPSDIAAELHRLTDEVGALRAEVARLADLVDPRRGGADR